MIPRLEFRLGQAPESISKMMVVLFIKTKQVERDQTAMCFTLKERQLLGPQGLLPPAILTPEQEVYFVMQNSYRWDNDLDRYIYMRSLQDRSKKLFCRTIMQNVELMMPIIYTPTVGQACLKCGITLRKPRGFYITIHDLGHVYDIICNWQSDDVKAIVVTDGERILGLGDLGAYGMGIPVGKLALYTALAGMPPHLCLPILIDVGTDNEGLLKDPLYIGLKQKRVRGAKYDALIDEFMNAVPALSRRLVMRYPVRYKFVQGIVASLCIRADASGSTLSAYVIRPIFARLGFRCKINPRRYGGNCLVHFEDFGNHNAFRLLEHYRNSFCTFNDDIQGTASVAVAGILASLNITGKKAPGQRASIGIAKLLIMALQEEGATTQEAYSKIWMVDSKGLIVKDRPSGGLTDEKLPFAQSHSPVDNLEDVVKLIKPTAIIGAAAQPGAFTEAMAEFNERPIIFALSNPTSKAECTAEQAYKATDVSRTLENNHVILMFEI
ncbi:hypothetical protein DPMN_050764 [Dreissena polymorpha]|uniref:Malic enzyme n=1 Tax=Dreissena polymorpha TaxID=45954 RepID=A0A9D4CHE4_DREPO|nr:hypothetical protein DPMN_050764 [Dreissena polymorpha]